MDAEYHFIISESWHVGTIPMARLAGYMTELAKLLGENEHVHFEGVEEGSVRALIRVEEPAAPKVRERVARVHAGDGPDDAMRAFTKLDAMLAEDNATGHLAASDGAEIIPFPGKNREPRASFGPFAQEGTLEGEIVSLRGKDETIHVILRDGPVEYSGCETTPDIGRRLSQYFRNGVIRLSGTGTWFRDGDGCWELRRFRIKAFEPLDDTPLTEVVAKLRATPGNEWDQIADPVGTLLAERHGDQEIQ